MRIRAALLEDWLRDRYFQATYDLGCSGVASWSLGSLRALTGIGLEDLDRMVFDDGPSNGSLELREAIADRYYSGQADSVMVTHGSSEAIFTAVASLLEPGDEVVVFTPGYHALLDVADAVGAKVLACPLAMDESSAVNFAMLEDLVSRRPKMIIANFPNNPTGTTLTDSELRLLVDLAETSGAYLLWDGAFAELTFPAGPLIDPLRLYERCVSFGTLSKAFGLPGLRVGWCAADPAVLDRFLPWRDRTTIAVSPLNALIAAHVMRNADVVLGARREELEANRALVADWLGEQRALVAGTIGAGGVVVFPRLVRQASAVPFCTTLLARHSVLAVPGNCFGHEDRFRLGFGCPAQSLRHGLAALTDVLQAQQDEVHGHGH
jgi:capreomycidine synthase